VGGACAGAAQNKPTPKANKVKIEATERDSQMLLH
jgi:hypothetical protein